MSSEPVKIEVDCPVAPHYTHLHHHHHHAPHLHHHHHHRMHDRHHLSHVSTIEDDDFVHEVVDDEEDSEYRVSEKIDNKDAINRVNGVLESEEEDHKSNDSGSDGISNNSSNLSEQSKSITNESDSSSNAISTDSDSSNSPRSGSPVSDEAGEDEEDFEEEEDEDSEQVGDGEQDEDGDNDDDDEDEFEDDDDDDEDGDDSDNDCDDIVDPVGTHYHYNSQQQSQRKTVSSNNQTILGSCNGTASAFDRLSDESDSEDDISFDGNCDENSLANNDSAQSPDILDGERMLEVTRKLVRSTERDPDRDLRKQVLLKTAIRKLPHFMDYNRYNDSFEQNFQLHSNNNNMTVNCLSTSQYYEHHHIHLNNHIDAQPKPYYHSVQPNAIQMSTTSLRKLDLNDDIEPDANNIEIENHLSYNNNNNDDCRTSLDNHHQHDYATSHHNLYDSYNQPENLIQTQPHSHGIPNQHDHNLTHQPRAIHDFSPYGQQETETCQSSMLGRHTTLDNLYQPLNGIYDIEEEIKTATDRTTIAFQVACDSCNFSGCANECTEKKLLGNLDATSATNHITPNGTTDELSPHQHNNHYHIQQNHQMTTANAFCASTDAASVTVRMPMKELETNTSNYHNLTAANSMIEGSPIVTNHEEHSETAESGSSESSATSNDSANSIISSHLNESTDELNGTSILETSLTTSSDFYQSSHDSGVILFSPRSNKRSSSSIGLDDEMDIDNSSTDLCTSTQQSSAIWTNVNQYKKLRKRDIID